MLFTYWYEAAHTGLMCKVVGPPSSLLLRKQVSRSLGGSGVLAEVERRQASAHIVLNPLTDEVAPLSEGDNAARLQVAQHSICRDDQIVAGDVVRRRSPALPQLNVSPCKRAPPNGRTPGLAGHDEVRHCLSPSDHL